MLLSTFCFEVPLEDEAVDIAIYCLSLMGKNTVDFLIEANRILKIGSVCLYLSKSIHFLIKPFSCLFFYILFNLSTSYSAYFS